MEQKKDLAKIALAAFLFAAAAPAHAILDNGIEAQRTYLAAGCKAHGCETTTDNGRSQPPVPTPTNPEASNPEGMKGRKESKEYIGDNYTPSGYNSQQSGVTLPTYVEDYRQANAPSKPYVEAGGMNNLNREYNTTTDYDYNRRAMSTTAAAATLTEAQLFGLLNAQARNIYLNLDPEGKSLAIQLASQDSYKDKNLAIKEAQRRMSERRGQINR